MSIEQQTIADLIKLLDEMPNAPEVLQPCNTQQNANYTKSRQVFNRRFDFMPPLIVKVKNTEQVSAIVEFATKKNMPFTVRSGGHDHEGECVATGKVLIDFYEMNTTKVLSNPLIPEGKQITQAIIQPGALFKQIKPILDSKNTNYPTGLGIAHGTCQSVAIAGYTMGGGWGPWTRLHGMGCERLAGATIVLGDGSIRYLGTSAIYHNENSQYNDEQNNNLLWAIRGGGGLSYGIVTEFFFIPFKLPEFPTSFVIKSTDFITKIKAIDIIAAWEKVIEPHNNPHLIGTNLQVIAKGVACDEDVSDDAVLDWQFNGHFGGTRGEFEKMINDWAESVIIRINNNPYYDDAQKYVMIKDIKQEVVKILNPSNINIQTSVTVKNTQGYPFIFESWDRRLNNGLSLEVDCPAPHKLTSRMPTPKWDETSRKQLVRSLQSTLLNVNKCEPSNFSATDDKDTSIEAYITLGAISGKFYAEKQNLPEPERIKISFPYQDRAFTIQYQAWWNQSSGKYCEMSPETKEQKIPTRFHENRAQDWIETCREFHIPHTSGSFISFKDASVPTKDYFSDNYQALINTKLTSSKDEKCLLRSRKTII